jgi:hypothetical protein
MDLRMRLAVAASVFSSVAMCLYARADVEPLPAVGMFLSAGPLWLVVLWILRDAQRRRVAEIHDLGFLLMIFWPFGIPWYAFASRGRGGWKLLLGLFAIVAAPSVTGNICGWHR